jgi:hypothetical protein
MLFMMIVVVLLLFAAAGAITLKTVAIGALLALVGPFVIVLAVFFLALALAGLATLFGLSFGGRRR